MSRMPSVSVILPVFNGAATIADTLRALLTQADPPQPLEIVVVDNGSTDATRDIVSSHSVTLLEEATRGPSAARNCGLRYASGEVIAHLDADTLPTRRWLAELVAPFADAQVHIAGGHTITFRPTTPAQRYMSRSQVHDGEASARHPVMPFVASLNMAVRRQSALAIGGWAEDMLTAEDVDFCHRILQAFPSRIAYQPNALLFHRDRTTDEALVRQAWGYGQGAAQLYRRYPHDLPWGARQWWALAYKLSQRVFTYAGTRIREPFGFTAAEDVEFALYDWRWTWWYWRGFVHRYRRDAQRT